MLAFGLVEDAILQECRNGLGNKVRAVDSLGGAWSLGMFKRLMQHAPAVFVGFVSGRPRSGADLVVKARFDVFVVVSHQGSEKAARRGDAREIGAYEILNVVLPRLHNLTVPDVGSLQFDDVRNLFAAASLDIGGTILAATYYVECVGENTGPADLAPFVTFSAKYDLDGESASEPRAEDILTLPQEE